MKTSYAKQNKQPENFPVASLLIPRHLRHAIHVLYAFARSADNFADEGSYTPAERMAYLQAYQESLDDIRDNRPPKTPLFQALKQVVATHQLPLTPLYQLLSALQQDICFTPPANYAALRNYCDRSANTIGELFLHLFHAYTEDNKQLSDAICTALQLIDFWQDVAIDINKDRVYIPVEDMQYFGVTKEDIQQHRFSEQWQNLMLFQLKRTRTLLLSGAQLPLHLPGRFGWEIRFMVQAGLYLIEQMEKTKGDVFRQRPSLSILNWISIAWRVCRYRQSIKSISFQDTH